MSGHTPGPWRTNGEGVFRDWPMGVVQIANIGSAAYGDDEKSANARLIAAAPDLLEVLREVFRNGIHQPRCLFEAHGAPEPCACYISEAGNAIAKAEEGQ